MSQPTCEYEYDFLGFIGVYENLLRWISDDYTVIDLGCYLAAQSYWFDQHFKYIGVDICKETRFTPDNAIHFQMSIQDFLLYLFPQMEKTKCFGICSYVEDFKATDLAYTAFHNIAIYYPGQLPRVKVAGKDVSEEWMQNWTWTF